MKTTAIFALPVAAVMLAGCDATTENQRTKNGAIIGAAVGGLIGASSDDDNQLDKGLAGAVIGGAVGAAIGNSLDKQAEDLRRDIGNDDITIVNEGSQLRVTMPQDLLFATDSDRLRSDLQADLRALAGNLNDYPDTNVFVVGHTDSTGGAGYNLDLSERRALAVANVLQNSGVSRNRLRVLGQGEAQPVSSNATSSGRAQNRRVEILIRPNVG